MRNMVQDNSKDVHDHLLDEGNNSGFDDISVILLQRIYDAFQCPREHEQALGTEGSTLETLALECCKVLLTYVKVNL
jgi:hypothetical protein